MSFPTFFNINSLLLLTSCSSLNTLPRLDLTPEVGNLLPIFSNPESYEPCGEGLDAKQGYGSNEPTSALRRALGGPGGRHGLGDALPVSVSFFLQFKLVHYSCFSLAEEGYASPQSTLWHSRRLPDAAYDLMNKEDSISQVASKDFTLLTVKNQVLSVICLGLGTFLSVRQRAVGQRPRKFIEWRQR
ncbi:hypothetical protein O181_017677 [Austropuccinia psidii MF-1]|uniref:Uncharacterized protein n=1 Tax=Austropuccinia psidii MF-1 TaxID=1389203 RepID=A0A9Q3C825_9BASI|nr:hypothetical protein [Austropuccinia psidii MF-1]